MSLPDRAAWAARSPTRQGKLPVIADGRLVEWLVDEMPA
jgi:hypothetical protein